MKSGQLSAGYDEVTKTWELIVKYHGDLLQYAAQGIQIEILIAGYAIVTIQDELIPIFSSYEEVEYVEKPKPFYFQILNAKNQACITPVTLRDPFLNGEGVLAAVIDSGIEYANLNFRNADGSTRILSMWDQTIRPDEQNGWLAPIGFTTGVEFSEERINEALEKTDRNEQLSIVPTIDITGHGTAVAGILAGSGEEQIRRYTGIAPSCELLIVKLGDMQKNSFPRTTEVMRAVTYAIRKALEWNRPLVINLSFGNCYGNHRGTSLLERFLDNASEIGKTSIIIGTGNEGASAGHSTGNLIMGRADTVELAIAEYELSLNVQLWKNFNDVFDIYLYPPNGNVIILPRTEPGTHRFVYENVLLLVYIGEPLPYSVEQEIYIDFIPSDTYLLSGIWRFELRPVQIVTGEYHFYLPSSAVRNENTVFLTPSPQITLTIPSTSYKTIGVGAYDTNRLSYADFSGRGFVFSEYTEQLRENGTQGISGTERIEMIRGVKPDIVAPGVDITTVSARGGYELVSGTSFATPIVAGSAVLLMQWGIVLGNDPFLYGDDCDIIGLNQRKAHKHWEFRWFSPNLSMQD